MFNESNRQLMPHTRTRSQALPGTLKEIVLDSHVPNIRLPGLHLVDVTAQHCLGFKALSWQTHLDVAQRLCGGEVDLHWEEAARVARRHLHHRSIMNVKT